MVRQKEPKLYFQGQFSTSKINKNFQKKKKIILGAHFSKTSIFEPLYFLKRRQIFDDSTDRKT